MVNDIIENRTENENYACCAIMQSVASLCWLSVFGQLLLLDLNGTKADIITEILLSCLHKYGFDDYFMGECFVAFVCDGACMLCM